MYNVYDIQCHDAKTILFIKNIPHKTTIKQLSEIRKCTKLQMYSILISNSSDSLSS